MCSETNVAATEEGFQGQTKEWKSFSLDACSCEEDRGLLGCIPVNSFERHGDDGNRMQLHKGVRGEFWGYIMLIMFVYS